MRPDPSGKRRRPQSGALLLWIALTALAGTLVLGVGIVAHRHPTLASDIWPAPDTAPRPVP